MSTSYIDELNESQREAVLYNDGPSLVIAGAGSGKTRVLTYKVARLLEEGLEPWRILALTFTNKAAREMKERIGLQVGENRARYLWMGTFHSMFLRILRTEADKIGFSPNFTIYDQTDSRNLIKAIIKEMLLDDKVYKSNVVQGRISNAKNRLITSVMYAADGLAIADDKGAKIPQVRDIYLRYQERLRQSDAMDFDDILMYTFYLFKEHPEVLQRYVEQFAFVLVDEYQDTNFAQHQIIWQLTGERQRVCVVGDDAQSIYSFRGANIDNILHFSRQYDDARVFKLEENYRSTKMIVNAANSLIEKNSEQIHKDVFSNKDEGEPLKVYEAYSDVEEGAIVARRILSLKLHEHLSNNEFAILYRTNAQSRIFEEALRKEGIAYRIYGGLSFYQRKEVKDVIAYFRMLVNPNDEEAFKRVINYPARGIGETTVGKIMASASTHQVSLWEVISDPANYELAVNKGTLSKLAGFFNLINHLRENVDTLNAYDLGLMVTRESGIADELKQDNTVEGKGRQENVQELLDGMQEFCETRREEGNDEVLLKHFLNDVALLTDQDSDDEDLEKVTLMTVHSAKGLEFDTVFIVGMEEQLFPSMMAYDNPRQMEEERRLLYVAVTRAETRCILSYAKSRYRYGKLEYGMPSRFLKDIDRQYIEFPEDREGVDHHFSRNTSMNSWKKRFAIDMGDDIPDCSDTHGGWGRSAESVSLKNKWQASSESSMGAPRSSMSGMTRRTTVAHEQRTSATPSQRRVVISPVGNQTNAGRRLAPVSKVGGQGAAHVAQLQVGQLIEHERFGIGEVLRVEGKDENCKAFIRFRNAGEKQLLLKFARFRVIE